MSHAIVEIDGSSFEGGGQVLRVALALSCIKRIPVHITKIRVDRNNPGLRSQHLKGVELIKDICNGVVYGAEIGSTEITFFPGEIMGGHYQALIETAGSISLLLQVALPCALFAPSEVVLKLGGGTNIEMAPQLDYMLEIFRPILQKFGATFEFYLKKRGYFPVGGGEVEIRIQPVMQLNGITLTHPGSVTSIRGMSFVAGKLPFHLSLRMAEGAEQILSSICPNIDIIRYKEHPQIVLSSASGIVLSAITNTGCILGGDALGKKADPPKKTGKRAGMAILKSIQQKACVDKHCQDQIIIFMALAKGRSSVRVGEISLHTRAAISVSGTLTSAKFETETLEGGANIICCSGS